MRRRAGRDEQTGSRGAYLASIDRLDKKRYGHFVAEMPCAAEIKRSIWCFFEHGIIFLHQKMRLLWSCPYVCFFFLSAYKRSRGVAGGKTRRANELESTILVIHICVA